MKSIRIFFFFLFLTLLQTKWPMASAEEPAKPETKGTETTQEALENARESFLDAMDALNRAGKLAYEENAPEVREKAKGVLEESKRLLEQWLERVQKEMDEQSPRRQVTPPESKDTDRSTI
ncbi:MAG: hypothetical protein HQL07_14990 [Nitrospirae bacterium]|nr:hypothetical protein [Magnetococcales bacterium]HAT49841.1 hypothetical protein [Alphaproteobacteria bacterium]